MAPARSTLERVARVAGYLLVGALVTAVAALVALYASTGGQRPVYDLLYGHVGPSEATEAAVLAQFLLASFLAVGTSLLVGDAISDRGGHAPVLLWAVGGMVATVVLFLAASLVGLAAFPVALVVVVLVLVAVPLTLYRDGVRSGGLHAFVGGVPVVALLLLLAGVGLGWGGGHVVVARELPADATVSPTPAFEDAPEVREDLFAADNCETDTDGRGRCLLLLRGYEHELAAVRALAAHGVRCPHRTATGGSGSVVVEHDGRPYRVTCAAYGD
jgi:hypothetical protein